jgi:hypothetical protein
MTPSDRSEAIRRAQDGALKAANERRYEDACKLRDFADQLRRGYEWTDEELTAIYKRANGEDTGKAKPLTTENIFRAMRAMTKEPQ